MVKGSNRVMKARQNQQQGQCKGRGRRQTRGYHKAGRVKKAGSKWSESCRQSRETEYRGNAQNVSRGKIRLRNVCREVCCLYVGE